MFELHDIVGVVVVLVRFCERAQWWGGGYSAKLEKHQLFTKGLKELLVGALYNADCDLPFTGI